MLETPSSTMRNIFMHYLIQMVPRLPPAVDGVGDYSLILARQLWKRSGIKTIFIVCDPLWQGPQTIEQFEVIRLEKRSPEDLTRKLCLALRQSGENSKILLQFVCYGYGPRGITEWIIDGLQSFSSSHPDQLLVMFHELVAESFLPWKSAFWLHSRLKEQIRDIASLASTRFTTTDAYAARLRRWGVDNVPVIPTYSGVGEPDTNVPMADREPCVVVFGRRPQRELVYRNEGDALRHACEIAGAEYVVDIGEELPSVPT
jgi:hypothetical protein